MPDNFDPNLIQDLVLRQVVLYLMHQVEELSARVKSQAEEIQRLRDENNRLKGEQGKPEIMPNVEPKLISSEKERRSPRPHHKDSKLQKIVVDRQEIVSLDKTNLPTDVQFKGYKKVIVQDIALTTNNVCFLKEIFYSPSLKKTYLAPNPAGFEGQFGPSLKALALTLYFDSGLSEPKLKGLFEQAGVFISTGQISNLLINHQQSFHQENQEILKAGLSSSPWQHIDTTATRLNGVTQNCHVLCNPLYTFYCTLPHRDRLSTIDALRGGATRVFRFNNDTLTLVQMMNVYANWQTKLKKLPFNQDLGEKEVDEFIRVELAGLALFKQKWVKDCLAITAYHAGAQSDLPVVRTLVCDDAGSFHRITEEVALCWIHDGRLYKKLDPRLSYNRLLLEEFREKYWEFYRKLLAYRDNPDPEEALRLGIAFDKLFKTQTGYRDLDERIIITMEKRPQLLLVLKHPELPLHNNPAELGVRQRVRKRDIILQPRSVSGLLAWDTFQSLAATCRKVRSNFYEYVRDRICQIEGQPSLAEIIQAKAIELNLGASWKPVEPRLSYKPLLLQGWLR